MDLHGDLIKQVCHLDKCHLDMMKSPGFIVFQKKKPWPPFSEAKC